MEVRKLVLNILFFTITIKKRKQTVEEIEHHDMVKKIYEENRDRQYPLYRMF
jgi:uncharacterized protein (TIGR02413 family)